MAIQNDPIFDINKSLQNSKRKKQLQAVQDILVRTELLVKNFNNDYPNVDKSIMNTIIKFRIQLKAAIKDTETKELDEEQYFKNILIKYEQLSNYMDSLGGLILSQPGDDLDYLADQQRKFQETREKINNNPQTSYGFEDVPNYESKQYIDAKYTESKGKSTNPKDYKRKRLSIEINPQIKKWFTAATVSIVGVAVAASIITNTITKEKNNNKIADVMDELNKTLGTTAMTEYEKPIDQYTDISKAILNYRGNMSSHTLLYKYYKQFEAEEKNPREEMNRVFVIMSTLLTEGMDLEYNPQMIEECCVYTDFNDYLNKNGFKNEKAWESKMEELLVLYYDQISAEKELEKAEEAVYDVIDNIEEGAYGSR